VRFLDDRAGGEPVSQQASLPRRSEAKAGEPEEDLAVVFYHRFHSCRTVGERTKGLQNKSGIVVFRPGDQTSTVNHSSIAPIPDTPHGNGLWLRAVGFRWR